MRPAGTSMTTRMTTLKWDYKSSETLSKEMKSLYDPFWHYGGHRSEIRNNRDYISILAFDFELIVYNDHGSIVVFENACPHRGARLLRHDKVACGHHNSKIQCHYHGWSYANSTLSMSTKHLNSAPGRFVQVEENQGPLCYGDGNPVLFSYRVDFCGDFIFFALNPMSSLREQVGGEIWDELKAISESINKCIDVNTDTRFECNWKVSLENALESYHLDYVHSDTLGLLKLKERSTSFTRNTMNSTWMADVHNTSVDKRLTKLRSLFDKDNLFNDCYFSIYLFPFTMISSTYGYSYAIQRFFPMTADKTNFISTTYSVRANMDMNAFYDSVVKVNRQIFDEDASVANSLQIASTSGRYSFVYNLKTENRIIAFHKVYDQYMN